jgi:phosphonate transport system substrate-binding protein
MRSETLVLGAVAYDPKTVTIWDGFKEYFLARGLPFDYVLYSNYEAQVDGLFSGHVDVAWNSPLAWIETVQLAGLWGRSAEAIAMRDTDCDLTSVIVVRADSEFRTVDDLRGRTVAVGAADSPQATLIPLLLLHDAGLATEKDFRVQRHDLLPGKHGDHIGGEREAARALMSREADATCMIDGNHLLFAQEGLLPPGATRILAQTSLYDHCNFSALDETPRERLDRFRHLLLSMSYEDPPVRRLLDLEGLRAWRPGRTDGYQLLERATRIFGTLDAWLSERKP